MNKINSFQEVLIVFLTVLIAYGYFSFGLDWNVNSRLALVKSFVEEGVFEIDAYQTTDLSTNDKSSFNGHYYSDKAIGSSLIGIIVYFPIHWFYMLQGEVISIKIFNELLTFLCISLPTAFIAVYLYLISKYITNSPLKAFIVTVSISLGTAIFKYSTAYYGHSLAATFYFLAIAIWFNAKQKKHISLNSAFVSSVLLGFMLITEYPTALLFFIFSFYILYTLYISKQLFNWQIYAIMILGFAIPICVLLYYNHNVFGSAFATGYSHEESEAFRSAHAQNLMGIGMPNLYNFWYQTFQPAIGIFWQSPILFLALPGWFYMLKSKQYRIEALFSFVAIFGYVLLFSGYYMWWGGQVFALRHLIPILPLFIFPLTFASEKTIIPVLLLALISIFQNLILSTSGPEGLGIYFNEHLRPAWKKHYIFEPSGMLLYDVCFQNVIKGFLSNNRGIDFFGLSGVLSLLPLLVIEISLLGILIFRQKYYRKDSIDLSKKNG